MTLAIPPFSPCRTGPLTGLALAALLFLGLPAAAQQPPAPETAPETAPDGMGEGLSLMEEGARLLMRGLMDRLEPALTDMTSDMTAALETLEPRIAELLALVDDIRNYQAPEILENGDILIRRRPEAPPSPLLSPDPPDAPDGQGPDTREPDAQVPAAPIDL